jgi:hypothetical protein
MARSQIITSKNPITGAIYLNPFDMKITLIVPSVTSHIRAKKIRRGRTTHAKKGVKVAASVIPGFHRSFRIY